MSLRFASACFLQVVGVVAIICLAIQLETDADASTSGSPPPWGNQGWIMPQKIADIASDPGNPTQEEWLHFGWDTFIALNWPHQDNGIPGEPDTSGHIVSDYLGDGVTPPYPDTAWYTFHDKFQLLMWNALPPGSWENPTNTRKELPWNNGSYRVLGLDNISKVSADTWYLENLFDTATVHKPVLDRNGRLCLFEIYANRSLWTYIENSEYYDNRKQKMAFNANGTRNQDFIDFPKYGDGNENGTGSWYADFPDYAQQGAISIKVAWKQLTHEEIISKRFYTRQVFFTNNKPDEFCQTDDGGPLTVGLVGMHLLRLTPTTGSTWFWSSFEHVDAVQMDANNNQSFLNRGQCQEPSKSGYTYTNFSCEDAVSSYSGGYPDPDASPTEVTDTTWASGVCDQHNENASQVYRVDEMKDVIELPINEHVNSIYQDALQGTPWQYFRQLGTIQPGSQQDVNTFIPPNNTSISTTVPTGLDPNNEQNPWALSDSVWVNNDYLTNVTMESYTQYNFQNNNGNNSEEWANRLIATTNLHSENQILGKRMNCINCHALAAPQGSGKFVSRNTNQSDMNPNQYYTPVDNMGGEYPSWQKMPTSNKNQVFTFTLNQAKSGECPADVNYSGGVDVEDLLAVINSWGSCPTYSRICETDTDGDTVVGIDDLLHIIDNWANCGKTLEQ
ncbi:MAG: hypothetical protein P8M22_00260 [Phycisphaerales bacterium]|nr:hypothetical protein [Phycisphaerales bacterium]